jgi:polar amino acid transport system substrate-binding protein
MWKKEMSAITLMAVLIALAAGAGFAGEAPVLERIVKTGQLRVGLSGSQPPLNATSRAGELMGLEVDLANLLGNALGVETQFVKKPFPELLSTLKAGDVDIVMSGMAITSERSINATFVGPYMLSGKSILTNSNALAAAEEAGEINRSNLKLAALANSTSEEFVKLALPEAQLVTTNDYDTAVNMVLNDEVDALVADMTICILSMMRYPDKGLATLTEPLSIEPVGIALSPTDPQLRNLLENYLRAFEGTGILDGLRKKWLESDSWIAALP